MKIKREINSDIPLIAPRVAAAAVVIKDRQVLLVKRANNPNQGLWAIPGGLIELGETLQEAAEREIREETGLVIKAKEPIHTFDFIEKDSSGRIHFHYVIIDLIADFVSGEPTPADDAMEAKWFCPAELKGLRISESTSDLLKKIQFML